jgi:hypothetical protein
MIRILKAGDHALTSTDRLYPGVVSVKVPTKCSACISFRKDGIQSIWLFGRGNFSVSSRLGKLSVIAYGGKVSIEARGRVVAFDACVTGYVAVAVEAFGSSQVEVFDNACSIVGRQNSVGTLHRSANGEFFDNSKVRALGTSRAVVHGENGFARVLEQSKQSRLTCPRD